MTQISYMKYAISRQRWASLNRTRKNILLRSLQMCFLPSRLLPEFEIVLFHNSTQFTEFPSPAQRAACRLTLKGMPIDQSEKI